MWLGKLDKLKIISLGDGVYEIRKKYIILYIWPVHSGLWAAFLAGKPQHYENDNLRNLSSN